MHFFQLSQICHPLNCHCYWINCKSVI